ncbi:MAG: nitronate monooxygenase [Trueperaceae bacterium]
MSTMPLAPPLPPTVPTIVQGGMGVAVSGWRLAAAVARAGQLGVVSGTALDTVLVRRLQGGDPGGAVQRALRTFPDQDLVASVLERFHLPEGRPTDRPYRRLPLPTERANRDADAVTMLGAYVEVALAKAGHAGAVGVNLLAKLQRPTLATLYGSMLAGVDWVLMGAGIPQAIPGALDRLAEHRAASIPLDVAGADRSAPRAALEFDPADHGADGRPALKRPAFVPIVASDALATMLMKRANGSIEGFVIEGPTAGGHNAPPRGPQRLDDDGQPIYGDRDVVRLEAIRALGVPFWLAGGAGTPEGVRDAQALGANGVQVGTLFAYCDESGLRDDLKRTVIDRVRNGDVRVRTDPRASPTGFPFKVAELPGTVADPDVREGRRRVCDLGYLREAAHGPNGRIVFRCPAEPVEAYVAKGGKREDTIGRACLCNGLTASVGMAQRQKDGTTEAPLVTSGDALADVARLLPEGRDRYAAADVIAFLTGPASA